MPAGDARMKTELSGSSVGVEPGCGGQSQALRGSEEVGVPGLVMYQRIAVLKHQSGSRVLTLATVTAAFSKLCRAEMDGCCHRSVSLSEELSP